MAQTYDLIVIGGGTGGLRTALASARMGKKTLLLEPNKLGGTCLNNGCIPTKAMLEAAHRYSELPHLKEFGISVTKPKVNMAALMKRVNGIVKEGQDHIKKGLAHSSLTVVRWKGKFIGKNTIEAGGETYKGKNIIISTGATNAIPPISGIDKVTYLTNESILKLKSLPKSIVMIGCGYISLEFATFFNFLGTKVTMLEYCDHILGMLDDDIVSLLEHYYEEKGIIIYKGVGIHEVKKTGTKYAFSFRKLVDEKPKMKKVTADAVFVATGRHPNTKNLGLDVAGVKVGSRGEVLINDNLETNVKNIYAIGDVTAKAMFAHAVKRESDIVLHNIFSKGKKSMIFEEVPWAVFTDPPVSGIGMNEKQAQEKKIKYDTLVGRFTTVGRAKIINDQRGFVKIVYEKKTEKILGAFMIGPQADNLIHEIIVLMQSSSATVSTLKNAIHIHPTLSEVYTSLR